MSARFYAAGPGAYLNIHPGRIVEAHHSESIGTTFRPVVVIDFEDMEQVERLGDLLIKSSRDHGGIHLAAVRAALREFANPTPPKPAEPTEDGWYAYDGGRQAMIFRLTRGQWYVITDSGECDPCEWGYISQALGVWNLVRVLSEGVTEVTP